MATRISRKNDTVVTIDARAATASAPPKTRGLRGLHPNVIASGFVSFFTDISSEMVLPVLPLFLTTVLGAPVVIVGLIEGIAESTASVLRVFAGWLSDKTERRKTLMLSGYALSNCTKPLLALAVAWPHVLAIRFADRVGKGIRGAPRDALIADSIDPAQRGRAYGLHRTLDFAGGALGPVAASGVLALTASSSATGEGDVRAVFWLASVPGLLALLVGAAFVRDRRAARRGIAPPRLGFRDLGRPFALLTLVVALFSLGNSSDAFLILRAQNAGMAVALIPLVYLASKLVTAGLSTPMGILADRIGRRPLLAVGYVVFAAVYALFALAPDALTVGAGFLLYGVYYALTDGVTRAFIADLVPASLRGTAMGTFSTATGLALLPASLLAGLLWSAVSPAAPFVVGAVLALLAALALLALPIVPATKAQTP